MSAPSDTPTLTILSGPQSGSWVPLESETLIGSDPSCQIRIPSAGPVHARIAWEGQGFVIYESPSGVWLNDDRVVGSAVIREGDILWLGTPGDPVSIMLQCRGMTIAPPSSVPYAEFVSEAGPA